MAVCLGCHGEGQHDMRDDDALFGENFSDQQLAAMREQGLVHPAGIVECSECEGTGVISQERYEDMMATARAFVDQLKARFEEEVANASG